MWADAPPKPSICGITTRLVVLAIIAPLYAACGSSDSSSKSHRGGGIGGSGTFTHVSIGTITDTGTPGRITVNGDEIDLSRATVKIDDELVAEAELANGMVAIVSDDSVAIRVNVQTTIKGPVYDVIDSHTLIVLGQRVLVDELTVLVNFAGVTSLIPGDLVEVSGLLKGNGIIAASRIVYRPTLDTMRVTGMIQEFDGRGSEFYVGDLTVDFSGADVSSLPNGFPEDDLVVVAEGQFTVFPGFIPRLVATKVSTSRLKFANKLEGFATYPLSAGEFVLGLDQVVQVDGSTIFAGGGIDEIVEGAKLRVAGSIAREVLPAGWVQFLDDIYLESNVLAVDRQAGTITLFSLLRIVVATDSLTTFAGTTNLDEINPNDHVLIRGRIIRGTGVIATRIEKRSSSARLVLQAPVDTTFGFDVILLGVPVGTSRFLDDQFQGVDEVPIGRDAFFDAAIPGTLVRAEGVQALTGLAWREIELEQ